MSGRVVIPQPRIYSCSEWGARAAGPFSQGQAGRSLVVHHMANGNRALIATEKGAVSYAFQIARECQNLHMDGNGWRDTGQSATISRDGIILEGRHGSLAAAQEGQAISWAHAADPDTGANFNDCFGVEHEGNYILATTPVPDKLFNASVWLYAWLCQQYKVDSTAIISHKQTGCETDCCGYYPVKKLQEQVHKMLLGEIKPHI